MSFFDASWHCCACVDASWFVDWMGAVIELIRPGREGSRWMGNDGSAIDISTPLAEGNKVFHTQKNAPLIAFDLEFFEGEKFEFLFKKKNRRKSPDDEWTIVMALSADGPWKKIKKNEFKCWEIIYSCIQRNVHVGSLGWWWQGADDDAMASEGAVGCIYRSLGCVKTNFHF